MIIRTATNQNRVGIVRVKEPAFGVYIYRELFGKTRKIHMPRKRY